MKIHRAVFIAGLVMHLCTACGDDGSTSPRLEHAVAIPALTVALPCFVPIRGTQSTQCGPGETDVWNQIVSAVRQRAEFDNATAEMHLNTLRALVSEDPFASTWTQETESFEVHAFTLARARGVGRIGVFVRAKQQQTTQGLSGIPMPEGHEQPAIPWQRPGLEVSLSSAENYFEITYLPTRIDVESSERVLTLTPQFVRGDTLIRGCSDRGLSVERLNIPSDFACVSRTSCWQNTNPSEIFPEATCNLVALQVFVQH